MIARRIVWAIVVAWFVVSATFVMTVMLPTDPARVMAGPQASADELAAIRTSYGLDDNVVVRYGTYVSRVVRGDLGTSFRTKRPVLDIIAERMWPTIQLALAALVLQIAIGIPLGVIAAMRKNRWPDRVAGLVGLLGQSAPPFVVGTILLYIVGYQLGWLPIAGYGEGFVDRLRHLVLPAMTLASVGVAYYSRVTRTEMLDALGEDYVRTARAKGLAERHVVGRHALRNVLGPIVTMAGLDLGTLLAGAIVTEVIFAWPGIGRESVQAIFEADLPVVAGVVLVSALAIALANLVADLVNLWLDPRLR